MAGALPGWRRCPPPQDLDGGDRAPPSRPKEPGCSSRAWPSSGRSQRCIGPERRSPRAPARRPRGSCAAPLPTGGGLGRRSPERRWRRAAAAPSTGPPAPHHRSYRPPHPPDTMLRGEAGGGTCARGRGPSPSSPSLLHAAADKLPSKTMGKKKKPTTKQERLAGSMAALAIRSVRHHFQLCRAAEIGFGYLMHPMRSPRFLPR